MDAWRKGRQLITLLEYKEKLFHCRIRQIENRLKDIESLLEQCFKEYYSNNVKIKSLTPSGVLHRADIYHNIRLQGGVLSRQQLIIHQINQLEDEKLTEERTLQEHRTARNLLVKRADKVSHYLYQQCHRYRIRCDNNAENEVQETVCYGRQKS